MKYVRDSDAWSDFPFERIMADFRAQYPASLFENADSGDRFEDGVLAG
jgi:hypothetical protein